MRLLLLYNGYVINILIVIVITRNDTKYTRKMLLAMRNQRRHPEVACMNYLQG